MNQYSLGIDVGGRKTATQTNVKSSLMIENLEKYFINNVLTNDVAYTPIVPRLRELPKPYAEYYIASEINLCDENVSIISNNL